MSRQGGSWVLLALLLLLAGCGRQAARMEVGDDDRHWRLVGRLAVSDGRDGGSGTLTWEQEGAYFMVDLRAPISGQSWRLSGDDRLCTLEGVRSYPLTANSPEELLQRELGWHLPVAQLRSWLRGRPLSDAVALDHDAAGQVSGFTEDGWIVSYRDFRDGRPLRISARKSPYQVRLAIKSWVALP
ncbi:MAG: outer membrane lipoprotein LolB [Xanthomonadales bacterium]|nr:outer membrane lipoprotein LolB [Xanthomonadales bacterium]MBK7145342.1 outer membrane lipoprotein LolB [Xanthomonadales bacterium]MCC6560970.1 outer membrane lipoprotein LolB [Xanthomonadales bacterium]